MITEILRRFTSLGAAIAEGLGAQKIGGGLPVGTVAPPFELRTWLNTPEGGPVELETFRGEGVFVELWSIQCPPCVATVDKVRRVHAGYLPRGVRTVTVHVNLHDPPAETSEVEAFLRDRSISYPVGLDPSNTSWDRFAFTHIPHGLLIDAGGKVEWSGSLYTHDVEKVLERFHGVPAPIGELPASAADSTPAAPGPPACEDGVCRLPGAPSGGAP